MPELSLSDSQQEITGENRLLTQVSGLLGDFRVARHVETAEIQLTFR